ncbi:hypothetical protein A1O3_06784 [Capronia epimyces CBS 606.96]|uniref:Hypervirulence associated protein TUDOR domain-containing protein n=1 Tax=Capronia epimyces CBS 606.96 TaxID=1182542 RepID=W9XR02_9EURO|nr:uncharacterized protein A1O3_06784 [Capronia epimyces CBS 606.96]EXJ82967.1 hypothetical protein A1O3_06784 [Capronia epimyces CBS 606.96]
MSNEEPEKGDKVSWNWGSGKPGGVVAETKTEGELAITTKRGNKVKKNADPDNPAVRIERSGNDVVKRASELNIEEKANGSAADSGAGKIASGTGTGTETKNGEKRKHDDTEDENENENEDKDEPALEENAEGKTVKGKGANGTKKQKKEPAHEEEVVEAKSEEGEEEVKPERKRAGRPKKQPVQDGASKKEPAKQKQPAKGAQSKAETRKPGRPKKGDGAPPKPKKDPKPRATEGIGSRTRSRRTT